MATRPEVAVTTKAVVVAAVRAQNVRRDAKRMLASPTTVLKKGLRALFYLILFFY